MCEAKKVAYPTTLLSLLPAQDHSKELGQAGRRCVVDPQRRHICTGKDCGVTIQNDAFWTVAVFPSYLPTLLGKMFFLYQGHSLSLPPPPRFFSTVLLQNCRRYIDFYLSVLFYCAGVELDRCLYQVRQGVVSYKITHDFCPIQPPNPSSAKNEITTKLLH